MKARRKITSGALFALYALIMLEGLVMATPFGLFLYSFYLPFLEVARQSVLTAWVAAFFLPHSVYETTSAFIEFIRWKGPYLFFIGLIGFFVFAAQVYYAKFRQRGVVKNFVYSYIRHPQYLFFILAGIGLLFMWPRMMMLILFTVMSVIYFYLAKFEERRMKAKHPEYSDYMKKTAMFIPGNPGGRIFKLLLGWIPNRVIAQITAVLMVSALIFGSALGLRNLTATHVSAAKMPAENILAISIYLHPEEYLRDVVRKTISFGPVQEALAKEGRVSFTAHLLPADYGMLGMFAEVDDPAERLRSFRKRSSLRSWLWGTDTDKLKVVLSKIDKPGQSFVPLDEIMDLSAKMTPVLVADMDLTKGGVTKVTLTSTTHFGEVPQPIF